MTLPYIPLRQAFAPMYAMPHVSRQMRSWWKEIRRALPPLMQLTSAGALATTMPFYRFPHCLLAQTCGYPLMTQLHRSGVRPLGCFEYDIPYTNHHQHGSVIIVRDRSPYQSLEELRGRRAVVNTWCSNTGMNLFRHAVAPHAVGKGQRTRFFSLTFLSGGHRNSMKYVRWGLADVAAIDAVTWHWSGLSRPKNHEGLRIIGETAHTTALPWVTGAWLRAPARDALWQAMQEAFDAPALQEGWQRLGIKGLREVSLQDYLPILQLEAEAIDTGYRLLK